MTRDDIWPSLALEEWKDTYATLHMWLQIVGKVRMAQCSAINHWWHVTLYVTSRGLTTGPIPSGDHNFQVDFDFLSHELRIATDGGDVRTVALRPRSVADFYRDFVGQLHSLGVDIEIDTMPQEVANPIPFERDRLHASYDPEYARRLLRILEQVDRLAKEFRGRFLGKVSPVHLFWGAFDLAVTRFSGRRAPARTSHGLLPASVDNEAYSHEVSSCGWWPGGGPVAYPAFYAYAYPEPQGFKDYGVLPDAAFYAADLGEFILPYDAVRESDNPDEMVLDFFQTTYNAAADLGRWDRAALERAIA